MSLIRICGTLAASCLIFGGCAGLQERPSTRSTVIVNAQIADGTGAALRLASVRIVGRSHPRTSAPSSRNRMTPSSTRVVGTCAGLHRRPQPLGRRNRPSSRWPQSQIAQGMTTHRAGSRRLLAVPRSDRLAQARRRDPAALESGGGRRPCQASASKSCKRTSGGRPLPPRSNRMAQLVDEAMSQGAIGCLERRRVRCGQLQQRPTNSSPLRRRSARRAAST